MAPQASLAWLLFRWILWLGYPFSVNLEPTFGCLFDFHHIFTYPSFIHADRETRQAIEWTQCDTRSHAPVPTAPKTQSMGQHRASVLQGNELLPREQGAFRACQYANLSPKRALQFPFVEDIAQSL